MKKIGLILVFMSYICNMAKAQSYNIIADASGNNPSQVETADLTNVSDSIANVWPASANINFKVFSFRNYVLNEYMDDLSSVWQAIPQSNANNYALIGLKLDSKNNGEFIVKLNIPMLPFYDCLNSSKFSILETKLKAKGQELYDKSKNYYSVQRVILSDLKNELLYLKDCCGNRFTTCNDCPTAEEIKKTMLSLGFRAIPIKFVSDIQPPTLRDSISSGNRQMNAVAGEQNTKILINGQELLTKDYIITQLTSVTNYGLSSSGFITKNQNLCNSSTLFYDIFLQFKSSTSSVKIWWHVWDDPDSETDILFEKFEGDEILSDKIVFSNSIIGSRNNTGTLCHGTGKFVHPSNFILYPSDYDGYTYSEGFNAHKIIQLFYLSLGSALNNDVELEYKLPLLNGKGAIYPDIVNLTTKELWEIKSVKGQKIGSEEVDLYFKSANKWCPNKPYIKGLISPLGPTELPWTGKFQKLLVWKSRYTGVITYELKSKSKNRPKEKPYAIPSTVWDDIYETFKKSAKDIALAPVLATAFVAKHSDKLLTILTVAGSIITLQILFPGIPTYSLTLIASTIMIAAINYDGPVVRQTP